MGLLADATTVGTKRSLFSSQQGGRASECRAVQLSLGTPLCMGLGCRVLCSGCGRGVLVSLRSPFMFVSVIYCCIINRPRTQRFKQPFIIVPHSPLGWLGSAGSCCLGDCHAVAGKKQLRLEVQSGFFTHLSAAPAEMAGTTGS